MGGPPSCLSARQETALVAFIDALLPPLSVPSSAEKCGDADQRFWEYRLSADSVFLTTVQEAISQKLSSHDRFMTQSLLTALSTALGTSAIFGVWTVHALAEWPVPERAKLLQRAQYSNFAVRRQAFQGLKRFLCGLAFSYTNDSGKNPFWEAMGYPGSPIQWQVEVVDQQRVQAAMERQLPIIQALEQSQQQLLDDSSNADGDECVLECDAVIVGSGSGGCVAAKVLSAAGYKVIVLEKGRYVAPENIKLSEAAALDQQYEQHGLLQTTSGTIMFLAGAGVGGGTAINWSCCLPLPDYVREEWMSVHGLKDYQSEEYETALHHILDALGVSSKSKCTHNAMNLKLQEGCDALKYDWENTGQVGSF